MSPIRFGAPSRQLFGLYQPPSGDADLGHAVVICNPFGQEAIRCHRLLRVLGERLARAGCHVLRFDYYGTGDSDGEDDAADLQVWTADVVTADTELRRRARTASSSWFGLRLGGTLALLASPHAPIRNLVAWDPVIDGAGYLRELADAHDLAQQVAIVGDPPGSGLRARRSDSEALGFPVPERFRRQVATLDANAFADSRAERIVILGDTASPSLAALEGAIRAPAGSVTARGVGIHIRWASDEAMNTAIVPAEPLQAIVESVTAP